MASNPSRPSFVFFPRRLPDPYMSSNQCPVAPYMGAATAVLGLLSASCRAPEIEAEALPFRVAIAPLEVLETGAAADRDGRVVEFQLKLDGSEMARAFAEELDGFAFTEVIALGLPEGVGEHDFRGWTPKERADHVLSAAAEINADVILTAEVLYSPEVHYVRSSASIDASWLLLVASIPARAFLGASALVAYSPWAFYQVLSWSRVDREYHLQLSVNGTVHDAKSLLDPGSGATLLNGQGELLRIADYLREAELEFGDRATLPARGVALLLPTSMIDGDARREHRALRNALLTATLDDWISQFALRKRELFHAPLLVPFEVRNLLLGPGGPDGWELEAQVLLDVSRVDVMDGYRVWVDGVLTHERAWIESTGEVQGGGTLFELKETLQGVQEGSRVRVEIRDVALRQGARTFTLTAGLTGRRTKRRLDPDLGLPPRAPGASQEP